MNTKVSIRRISKLGSLGWKSKVLSDLARKDIPGGLKATVEILFASDTLD